MSDIANVVDAVEAASLILTRGGMITEEAVQRFEGELMEHEQADCDVVHHFYPGIYVREVRVRAGVFAVGHHQKNPHLNYFMQGRVKVLHKNGESEVIAAPMSFMARSGRKIGEVLEYMVWHNIYPNPTEETDIRTLEAMHFIKSDGWAAAAQEIESSRATCECVESDRASFQSVIAELGVTEDQVRKVSENTADQIPFPHGSYKLMVDESPIDGLGLFATARIEPGEVIALARLDGMRTPAGRYSNHSANPNAEMKIDSNGNAYLIAAKVIRGNVGGLRGEEITTCYKKNVLENLRYANEVNV